MATFGQKGSFLGFTYNNIHSSTLGITRIISNRLTDNLIPSLKDITTNVDGKNGMAIWGAYYTKRVFTVSFAFQGLDESQFQLLQQFSQAKAIHVLMKHPIKSIPQKSLVKQCSNMQYLMMAQDIIMAKAV